MNQAINESETVETEDTILASEENVNPLDKFLPSPPKDKCPEELQVSSVKVFCQSECFIYLWCFNLLCL